MNHSQQLNFEQLIEVFALTKTATAIHIGETAVIFFANDAMLQVWGKSKAVIGLSLEEALPELKGQPFIDMFAKVWREGLTISGRDTPAELDVDGKLQTFYFDFEYRAILDKEGKTFCILHSATDVTERFLGIQATNEAREKTEALEREQLLNEELATTNEELATTVEELRQSQYSLSELNNELESRVQKRTQALSESELRFRTMAENTDMLIATNDTDGGIVYLNQAWLDFFGKSLDDILSIGWTNFVHPDDKEFTATSFLYAFEHQQPYSLEFRLANKNGEYRWLLAKGSPRFYSDGTFAGSVSTSVDITERKLAEIERQNLNAIIESSNEIMGLARPDFSFVYCNPAALNKLGWASSAGRTLLDCVYPEDRAYSATVLSGLIAKEICNREVRFYNELTGEPFWVDCNAFVIKDKKNEEIIGIGIVNPDITDRKNHEEELQHINEQMAASNEELLVLNEELATTNEELEASYTELVLSEERFRNLIRQAPLGICIISADDLKVKEVNDAYLELVGRKREDLEDKVIWEGVAEVKEIYAPILQDVIDNGAPFVANEHEVRLIRNGVEETLFLDFVYEPVKSATGHVSSIMAIAIDVTSKVIARRGIEDVEERIRLAIDAAEMGTFDFNYVDNSLNTSERFNQIFGLTGNVSRERVLQTYHPSDVHLSAEAHQNALTTGKIYYEARLIINDTTQKWIRVQGNVYFDWEGKRTKALGTVMDITDFKRLQQQKDDFISIASHELKTPITSLKASLQLLERMKEEPDAEMFTMLINQCSKSMHKISELVEDLLNVSSMNEGQMSLAKKHFTIAEMLDSCCNHVRVSGKHDLILQGDRNLQIFADENRIDQVVVNLVNNAVKYAPNSREIYLIVEKIDNWAKVSVKDNGPGIAPQHLPHLFDRYFRADESGIQVSGLGLGLYISADIIARHGGKIGVDTELGKGSTFWFTLPLD